MSDLIERYRAAPSGMLAVEVADEMAKEIVRLQAMIDSAIEEACDTQPSWEWRCYAMAKALGANFDKPTSRYGIEGELRARVADLESVVDAIKDLRYEDAVAGVKLWDEIQKLIAATEQEGET